MNPEELEEAAIRIKRLKYNKGYRLLQIREVLKQAGYDKEEINEILIEAKIVREGGISKFLKDRKYHLILLAGLIIVIFIFVYAPSYNYTKGCDGVYADITILGDYVFQGRVIESLNLLRERSCKHFKMVAENVEIIKPIEARGMAVGWVHPGDGLVNLDYYCNERGTCVRVLVHEVAHHYLYNTGQNPHDEYFCEDMAGEAEVNVYGYNSCPDYRCAVLGDFL